MLIGGVIDDQFGDDTQAAPMGFLEEHLEIAQRTVRRMDIAEIGDVVAVVLPGRREKREQPNRRYAQLFEVVELLRESPEVAHAIRVAVVKGADVGLVNNRVFIPDVVGIKCGRLRLSHTGPKASNKSV